MDRKKQNQMEWKNPDSWGGPKWMAVYFSKKDTRICVPKRIPWMGWTINLARTGGVVWLLIIMMLLILLPVVFASALK